MIKYLFGLPFSRRQKKLADGRAPMTKAAFVADIVESGGDVQAADLIWNNIKASAIVEKFSPHPDDSLSKVLGIAEEELDEELILQVFKELDMKVPDQQFTKEFGVIDSARQVAQFVHQWRSTRTAGAMGKLRES